MAEYTELIKALRHCYEDDDACETCQRWLAHDEWGIKCKGRLISDAAAAIEELSANVADKDHLIQEQTYEIQHLRADVKRQQEKMIKLAKKLPKLGEWIEENRRPRSSQFVCSECHRTAYDPQPTRDKAWRKRCRYAYCPNCGAKMEVQDG